MIKLVPTEGEQNLAPPGEGGTYNFKPVPTKDEHSREPE